jgi:leucyl-tRNA synthetase
VSSTKRHSKSSWPSYHPQAIEPKWQKVWEEAGLHLALESGENPKFYCLDFFPYPSGDGLHVGHCRNYIPTDVTSRYMRMRGYNVLHPMGWDAFGEPAEQYAVEHGVHPRLTTDRNTANFRRQMTLIGASYDWTREIDSSRPEFYRWTQAFFLLLYERGLAYRDTNWQWWCPTCQTTLSSHEVDGGVCWRGHTGVIRREIPAWYFKITAYADQLLAGLDEIDWPERIKTMQRDWIGRSEGVQIDFPVTDPVSTSTAPSIPVFTTRPDTLYGVTFFVLAPEHPLVSAITRPEWKAQVEAYQAETTRHSEIERMTEERSKSGVFTGGFVTNPLSGERIPVWIADYVLPTYGTGAVMGVPAHDQRDFEFARQFGLPVKPVVAPPGQVDRFLTEQASMELEQAYTEPGIMVNSGPFNGLPSQEDLQGISRYIEEHGLGHPMVSYRMRDWLISRQRYWGTPIPIVYCEGCGEVPIPKEQLPVLLPEMENFQPDGSGRSALSRSSEFVNTTCPRCGGPARRETDTMGGFACSSWYFLRFTSPHYQTGPFDPQSMRYWMPVDLYVGGAEQAVLHLLYARFWTRVLADAGLVLFREPFPRLMSQGQMISPLDGRRMAKSRGNTITPDSMVQTYGADALRVYELFMAPFDQDVTWSTDGIIGTRRFLDRVWSLFADTYEASQSASQPDPPLERATHRLIRDVSQRIEGFRFNTMVSALMEFTNLLSEHQRAGTWHTITFHRALETLLLLLAPAAPHIADELWQRTGHTGSVHRQAWPVWDAELAREELFQVAVQVNGKLRQVIEVPSDASQAQVQEQALSQPKVQQNLEGKTVKQVFYVPGKILNLVTN